MEAKKEKAPTFFNTLFITKAYEKYGAPSTVNQLSTLFKVETKI